jgi:hypothetical protein
MRAFWIYSLARAGVLAVTYVVVWGLASIWFDPGPANWLVVLVSLVVSALISMFALARLRNDFAVHLSERAGRLTERIEESRRAEDVD